MKAAQVVVLLFVGIAIGCVVWFGLFRDVHEYKREVSQEERKNEAVGAEVLPKEPIKIVIKDNRMSCVKVQSASIDGENIVAYLVNRCSYGADWVELHWKLRSPDGTTVSSSMAYITTRDFMDSGERVEYLYSLKYVDARVASIEFRVTTGLNGN